MAMCLDIELPLSRATAWQRQYTSKSPGVCGERWIFPNFLPEMEKMTSRRGATLPASPKESVKHTGIDVLAQMFEAVALLPGAYAVLER